MYKVNCIFRAFTDTKKKRFVVDSKDHDDNVPQPKDHLSP